MANKIDRERALGGEKDLCRANLRGANLRGADLCWADLSEADLRGADLREAGLGGADLRGTRNISPLAAARLNIVPEGELVVYKKAGGRVVTLRVPAEAPRSCATGRKCRAAFADVLAIGGGVCEVRSTRGGVYRVGERTHCHAWDPDRWNECSGGIHFFLTREEAEDWCN